MYIDQSEIRVSDPRAVRANFVQAAKDFEQRKVAHRIAAEAAAERAQQMLKEAQARQLEAAVARAKAMEAVAKYRLHYSSDTAPLIDPEATTTDAPIRKRFIADIVKEVAATHGITVDDLKSPCRTSHLVKARMEACYTIAKERPDVSWKEIGRRLGGRDHTTAVHSATRHAEIHGLPLVVRK